MEFSRERVIGVPDTREGILPGFLGSIPGRIGSLAVGVYHLGAESFADLRNGNFHPFRRDIF